MQLKEKLHFIIENFVYTSCFFHYVHDVGFTHIVPFACRVVFTGVCCYSLKYFSCKSNIPSDVMNLHSLMWWPIFIQSRSSDLKVSSPVDGYVKWLILLKTPDMKGMYISSECVIDYFVYIIGCDVLLQLQICYKANNQRKHDSVSRQIICLWGLFHVLCI